MQIIVTYFSQGGNRWSLYFLFPPGCENDDDAPDGSDSALLSHQTLQTQNTANQIHKLCFTLITSSLYSVVAK